MSLLALLLALSGFALFALATHDLHQRWLGTRPPRRRQRRLRRAAWAALLLALPPCLAARGLVFGPVLWSGMVMFAAAVVFLSVNFWPRGAAEMVRKRNRR
ncbi:MULTISPECIES: DUF3325 family protein [unclassified Sphingomonas]|uniref:DUF3325 family protein n=1 Tax=unclassified Sphingomonas TaxID=196159 RepID=UPI0002E251E8|nr:MULTISPECIES: DUF3325 family protein [unclassified Sphingomonas]KTF68931.1 hypothetical protein ATB93_11510 [Sphingomonas sp. WG]